MKRTSCFSAAAAALAIGAFVLTGCKDDSLVPDGPGEGTSPELIIDVTGENIEIPAEGGNVEVTYELTNPVEDGYVSASCEVDWIVDLDSETAGKVIVSAEKNDSGTSRSATLTVTYTWTGGEPVEDEVELVQPAAGESGEDYDYEYEMNEFLAYFYEAYGNDGEDNYYVWLSDRPFSEDGYAEVGGTYYLFDMYADPGTGTTIPAGTYTLGADGETAAMTFSDLSMYLYQGADEASTVELYFTEGTLVVTADAGTYTFDAVLTDSEGKTHHLTYTGPADIQEETDPDPEPGDGGLGEPVDFEASLAAAVYTNEENDVMTVTMQFTDMDVDLEGYVIPPGAMLTAEVYMPFNEEGKLALGTYEVADTYEEYTVATGMDFYGYQLGTYVVNYSDESTYEIGYISSGTMEITGSRDFDLYTITCDFTTAEGVSVKCTYEGNMVVQGMPGPLSTLTGDYTLDLTDAIAYAEYYGDYYYTGGGNWVLNIDPASGVGDALTVDFVVDGLDYSAGIPTGTYKAAATDYPEPGEYLTGFESGGYLYGTLYLDYVSEGIAGCAPAISGDLNITNNSDGTYELSFSHMDDLGHTWSGSWAGTISTTDGSSEGYSVSFAKTKSLPGISVRRGATTERQKIDLVQEKGLKVRTDAAAHNKMPFRKTAR